MKIFLLLALLVWAAASVGTAIMLIGVIRERDRHG